MVQAVKESVIIRPGGVIEIRRPDLPAGAAVEVVFMVERSEPEPPPITELLGKAHSGYTSGEDADAFLRAERLRS